MNSKPRTLKSTSIDELFHGHHIASASRLAMGGGVGRVKVVQAHILARLHRRQFNHLLGLHDASLGLLVANLGLLVVNACKIKLGTYMVS